MIRPCQIFLKRRAASLLKMQFARCRFHTLVTSQHHANNSSTYRKNSGTALSVKTFMTAPNSSKDSASSSETDSLSNKGLEGRYATALFNVAVSSPHLDAIYENLESLDEALRESPVLSGLMLSSPSILPVESVPELLNTFTSNFSWNEISRNFVDLLFANKRMHKFREIFIVFQKLYRSHKGLKYCAVTSAKALTATQQRDVIAAVQNRVGKSFKLISDFKVSPSIMGGFVVMIDDQVLDFSVSSRLEAMQGTLMEPFAS